MECNKQFRKSTGNIKYCSVKCRREAESHTPEELLRNIRNIIRKLGRVPARREAEGIGDACRKFFGSWNKAIIAAGFQPNRSHSQRMYKRVETKATDGHRCDSTSEAIIDDWLTKNGISHEKDVSYPQTNHKADWAIEKGKVFIEYFGLANDSPRYDRAVQKKIQFCRKYKIKLIEIYPSDLYPKACLDSKLKNEIGALY
ncbi:hypothetical protein MYX06_05060 [Patescibacteria group bacterium AH-259-L05]|nr:hypothetical protein [Patescibacteria group bacterium AH-259-L05]